MTEAATFDDWLIKYGEIYEDPSRLSAISCPNCASRELNLVMVLQNENDRQGWGAFWCNHCMTGVAIDRAEVREGIFTYADTPGVSFGNVIPDYKLIQP